MRHLRDFSRRSPAPALCTGAQRRRKAGKTLEMRSLQRVKERLKIFLTAD
jgi:hypothetical protein